MVGSLWGLLAMSLTVLHFMEEIYVRTSSSSASAALIIFAPATECGIFSAVLYAALLISLD